MKAFAFGGPLNLAPFMFSVAVPGGFIHCGYGQPVQIEGGRVVDTFTARVVARFYRSPLGSWPLRDGAHIRRVIALGGAW